MKNAFRCFELFPARGVRLLAMAILLAWGMAASLVAAPFDRQISFTQPDGTPIQLHGKGDEFAAVFETLDGYTVVFDQGQRAYCYARQAANGELASTGTQVQLGNPVTLGLVKGVRMSAEARKKMVVERWQLWEQGMQIRQRWEAQKAAARAFYQPSKDGQYAPPPFTTTGLKVGLTLLIDFSDDPATLTQAEVVSYLNSDNYTGFGNNGSVKEYFEDNSGGQLTYTNVVTVYVRAPNPKTTYNVITQDGVTNANTLIKDALDTLKALPNYTTEILPTFDALTVDNNNEAVAFNVFYTGDNGGVWSMGLWPHSSALYIVGAQELSPGGKKVFRYQITNIGNQLEISTFCHENGHMLCGYPDIYDYDYDSIGGAGLFCLMNSGGIGGNPSQICAYLKRASGWGTTTELDADSSLVAEVTASAGTNFNHFYRFQNPNVPTEYYLVENRQQVGRDALLPASGIAIWHVDELGDRDDQRTGYNSTHANYECSLIQADNQYHFQRNLNDGDARDLYYSGNPAVGYANEFSDNTAPSARWWDGSLSEVTFADFSESGDTMTFRVGSGLPNLKFLSATISGGNGNGVIDFNECNDLTVTLTNAGIVDISFVEMTLSTLTPGVALMQQAASVPLLPAGTAASNSVPFKVSTAEDFICGTPIDFVLVVKSLQASMTNLFRLATGERGDLARFDSLFPVGIPDADTNGAFSPLLVTGVAGAIGKVMVSLHIEHTFASDLTLELIAPDGTTNLLAVRAGANGRNYGVACSPDSSRTLFDDDATNLVASGFAPFVGSYRPEEPLAAFVGKSGAAVNGYWMLRAVDQSRPDVGVIQCWSLLLYPAVCTDGGGQCPGNDLAVKVSDDPDPVVIGSNLVYTITVTNTWSKLAKGVVLNQSLPSSVAYVSATTTQGTVNYGGNVVTANIGNLPAGSAATITVTVLPVLTGTISSTINAASAEPDIHPADNVVTVTTSVLIPSSDLAVTLSGAPNPATVGGTLTYTAVVRNNGPATASGIVASNNLTSAMLILGASSSKGTAVTSGESVVGLIGTLTNGETATVTIVAMPLTAGTIRASAHAFGGQNDPFLANNFAVAAIVVGQAADLGISLMDQPDPAVLSSNFSYFITVTNAGPNTATNVVVSHALPGGGYRVISSPVSQGSTSLGNGTLAWDVGSLAVSATASMTVVGNCTNFGTLNSFVTVSAAQTDPNLANNAASAVTVVAPPFVVIKTAGATLTSESSSPVNGSVDVGETVTFQLRLRNTGNVSNTNLVATLLASGGVTPITLSQSYGVLPPGGLPESRWFTLTAGGTNGGTLAVTLQLLDGPNDLGTVTFDFPLPNLRTFANPAAISIPDEGAASSYPSTITVGGLSGLVGQVTVTLSNLNHSYPDDLDILLVAPGGQRVLLMSDAGENGALFDASVTLDGAAAESLPDGAQILSARYRPADYEPGDPFANPAPAGPYAASLANFGGANPNGDWKLYVVDDTLGDAGSIAGGWQMTIKTITPVNQVADLQLSGVATPMPGQVGESLVYTFTVTNAGPNAAGNVALTNRMPVGARLLAPLSGPEFNHGTGSNAVSGNYLYAILKSSSLPAGATAAVTSIVSPTAVGPLLNTATVTTSDTDLNPVNNTVSVGTTVPLPVADVGILEQLIAPDPVTFGSAVTFTVTVTNKGPRWALQVVLTNTQPEGVSFLSASTSIGSTTIEPVIVTVYVTNEVTKAVETTNVTKTVATAALGDLPPGGSAEVSIVATAATIGTWTNTAGIKSASTDEVMTNDWKELEFDVVAPAPRIVAVQESVALLKESNLPPNGAIEKDEEVTVSLALTNSGSADTTDLWATLEPSGGVTLITNSVSITNRLEYGVVAHGGAAVSRDFTFVASGDDEGLVTATLRLRDGTNDSSVTFTFQLPVTKTFANTNTLTIPDSGPAVPYPSTIVVSNVNGRVSRLAVTLHGL